MNFKEFSYRVEAEVEFTREELNQLKAFAEGHYDGKCRAAAERGGVLYGMINQLFDHGSAVITVTNNSIDLLCKIAEGDKSGLHRTLTDIHRKMTAEWRRINNVVEWKAGLAT